jgi:hypothetical protein
LLAKPAIDAGPSFAAPPVHAGLVCAGVAGAIGAPLGAILVLATRDFGFSVDADHLYRAAYATATKPEVYLLRSAESYRQRRVDNRPGVRFAALSRGRCSRSPASRPRSPSTEPMATSPQSAPKPSAAPTPSPQPPKSSRCLHQHGTSRLVRENDSRQFVRMRSMCSES